MNVLWRLSYVCPSAQECPSSVVLPVLRQETRTGPNNLHLLDSGAKHQTKPWLFFSLPVSQIGDQASLLVLIPWAAQSKTGIWAQVQVPRGSEEGCLWPRGLCGTWFISPVQSWSGRTQACILVSLAVWWLWQKCNCEQSFIPVDAARSKKFTSS